MAEVTLKRIDRELLPDAGYLLTAGEQRRLQNRDDLLGIAAFEQEICIGILLFSVQSRVCCIERAAVVRSWQHSGVGSRMLGGVIALAQKMGLQLAVPFAASGQRDPVYRWIAARPELTIMREDGFIARVERETIAEAAAQLSQLHLTAAQPLFAQPRHSILALCDRIAPFFPAIAAELRGDKRTFREDISFCCVSDGAIKAVSLAAEDADGLCLRLLFAESRWGKIALGALYSSMCQMLETTDASHVCMTVTGSEAARLLDRICPSYEITKRLYTGYSVGLFE